MRTLITIFCLAAFSLFFQQSANAQDPNTNYVIVEYMKVKPGMADKYNECEAVWKIIHQARVKMGLITRWDLEQVIYPSGTSTEYDYLTITHLKNWSAFNALNASWDDATWAKLTNGLSAEQLKLANNAEEYRDLVKREIWTAGDAVFAPGAKNPEYRVENYMNVPSSSWNAWVDMETNFVKPVHEKNIAMGNRAGWLMGFMVLPRGDDYPYQASTIDYFNTWDDMNKDEGKAWEAVYPKMTQAQIGQLIDSTRSLARTELRRLVSSTE
ncbi:MAG: hypothetical protein IPL65_17420 [Lewinellaceae bacterium]|nr:hypothetical protein [Lewinellaceae bacterium]